MSVSNGSATPGGISPGQAFYAMYPTSSWPAPGTAAKPKKREIAGWKEYDYLDYADFDTAMKLNQEITYALCQWLIRQPHENPGDPFTQSEWNAWYRYALDHCPRFAREQPRRH